MISIIVAVAQNGIIGGDNSLLWHITEDLQRFTAITTGHPVVMGRKTFESLGRPLPKRRNVVITRQDDFTAEGVEVVHSLEEAVALFGPQEEVFIIGGGEIYRQAMDIADRLYITVVHHDYQGDTRFPEIDEKTWARTSSEYNERGRDFEYPFEYIDYIRKR